MRRPIVFTFLVLCVAAVGPPTALGAAKGTDRPLRGTSSSTTTVNIATVTGTSDGTGRVSHLGRIALHVVATSGAITGPNTFSLGGTASLVAANGDRLFLTVTGTGTFTGITVGSRIETTTVYTVTGGTGRFAGASGMATGTSQGTIVSIVGATVTSHDTATLQGRISY